MKSKMSFRPLAAVVLLASACGGSPTPALVPSEPPAPSGSDSPNGPKPVLVVQGGHTNNIQSLSLSRDGSLLASTGSDALVKLWDVRMGRELRTFTGHSFATSVVRFSPDDAWIASGGWDRELRLWNLSGRAQDFVLSGHTGAIFDLVFTPDSRHIVSGGMKDAAVCWDLAARVPRGVYPGPPNPGDSHFSMHPSGSRVLVAGHGDTLIELNPLDCSLIRESRLSEKAKRAAYSPSGREIAVRGEEKKVLVLDADTLTERSHFEAEGTLRYRLDGALIVGNKVFESSTGHVTATYVTEPETLSGDGTLFASVDATGKWATSTTKDGTDDPLGRDQEVPRSATIYATDSGQPLAHVASPGKIGWYGNAESPFALAHAEKEPLIVAGTADGAVRVWDLRKPNGPRLFARHTRVVHAVAFSPNGTYLGTCGGAETFVFRVGTGEKVFSRSGACNELAFNADETFVYLGQADGDLEAVELKSGKTTKTAKVGSGAVVMVARSGKEILASTQDSWDFVAFDESLTEIERENFSTQDSGGVRLNDSDVAGTRAALGLGYHKLFVSMMETIPNSPLVVFDRKTNKVQCMVKNAHQGGVTRVRLNRSGSIIASGGGDGIVKLWDTFDCHEIASFPGDSEVWGLEFSEDQSRLSVLGADGSIRLYEIGGARNQVATFVGLGDEDFVIALPDHHFMASRGGLSGVSFRVGLKAVPFEQYDLRLNRPDLVMKALGKTSPDVVSLLSRAHDKRLEKLGFTEAMLSEDFALPELALLQHPPLSTTEKNLTLRVRAEDKKDNLDRLLVSVNDVPVFGTKGLSLRGKGKSAEIPVPLELGSGENLVSVSVLSERGVESLRETFPVKRVGAAKKPNLWVITLGVSKYRDQSLNLDYAAKDANDIATFWKKPLEKYGEVRVTELLDDQATRVNFERLRAKLESTSVDDQIVLFMAGHGMLDEKLDYYFVTHDFLRDAPSQNGLPYEAIEGLLDGIPARKKLVLIDTCHSGEVDDGATAAALPVQSGARSVSGVGTVKIAERKLILTKETSAPKAAPKTNASSMRGLLGELFADLRRGSGAVVISSAGGSEAALESSRWKNGVFTFSVLEGLEGRRADKNRDSEVEVSELRDYVMRRVSELTQGAQTPTARRENLHTDFVVY